LATEIITNAHKVRHAGLFTSSSHNSLRSGVWRDWLWPGMLQSRESWFEFGIYVLKNLPVTQH